VGTDVRSHYTQRSALLEGTVVLASESWSVTRSEDVKLLEAYSTTRSRIRRLFGWTNWDYCTGSEPLNHHNTAQNSFPFDIINKCYEYSSNAAMDTVATEVIPTKTNGTQLFN